MKYRGSAAFSADAYVARWFPGAPVSGDERVVPCPGCGRPKCWWNVRKGVWVCFRCGARGTSFAFVRAHLGIDDAAAARAMAGESYAAPPAPYDAARLRAALGFPGCHGDVEPAAGAGAALPAEYRALPCETVVGRAAWAYLAGRGVTADQVATHRIGFAARGPYAGCVILPVVQGGGVVYFQARKFLRAGEPKYLNPPSGATPRSASEVLVNLDVAAAFGRVVVVEGYFDALAEGPVGVALLGTTLSDAQAALLAAAVPPARRARFPVTVKLDGDAAGRAASFPVARRIAAVGFPGVAVERTVGDPDERLASAGTVPYTFAAYVAARVAPDPR